MKFLPASATMKSGGPRYVSIHAIRSVSHVVFADRFGNQRAALYRVASSIICSTARPSIYMTSVMIEWLNPRRREP